MCGASLLLTLILAGVPDPDRNEAVRWTPHAVSTGNYESTPAFTPDGRTLYFLRGDRSFRQWRLLVSNCENGMWTGPRSVSFAATTGFDADPFITPDGKRLYFVSTRHDPGNEDLDIYYVERVADGGWSDARRLPEPVNSPASELFPRLDGNGTLYFGSQREGGFGGTDIYTAGQEADGKWRVDNLGPAVNTAAHEYEAEISRDGRTLVLVADRGDRSHLYRFSRSNGQWIEQERLPARPDVFQVGPVLSPGADRLLFAQHDSESRNGEMFLLDLQTDVETGWPPVCGNGETTTMREQ